MKHVAEHFLNVRFQKCLILEIERALYIAKISRNDMACGQNRTVRGERTLFRMHIFFGFCGVLLSEQITGLPQSTNKVGRRVTERERWKRLATVSPREWAKVGDVN